MVSGQSHCLNTRLSPSMKAVLGSSAFIAHCATSIQCEKRSVIAPPPKFQNHRHRWYFSCVKGWSGAPPSHCFQSSCAASTGFGTQFNPKFCHQYVRTCVTCPSDPPWISSTALRICVQLLCFIPHCII